MKNIKFCNEILLKMLVTKKAFIDIFYESIPNVISLLYNWQDKGLLYHLFGLYTSLVRLRLLIFQMCLLKSKKRENTVRSKLKC